MSDISLIRCHVKRSRGGERDRRSGREGEREMYRSKESKKKKELREQHGYHSYSWLESTFESHHLVLAVSFKYLRTER